MLALIQFLSKSLVLTRLKFLPPYNLDPGFKLHFSSRFSHESFNHIIVQSHKCVNSLNFICFCHLSNQAVDQDLLSESQT